MFKKFIKELPAYTCIPWRMWDFSILNNSPVIHRQSNKDSLLYSRLIITADTETSKGEGTQDNHVVIWAIHIQFNHQLIVTLYGRKPSEFADCIQTLKNSIPANKIYVYFHNWGYDWTFLRKFLIGKFLKPNYQLNLKPHCPLLIEFDNGVIFRDSLPLAQRRLEKWAVDLHTEHVKRSGDWDYSLKRHQNTPISGLELGYLEGDVVTLGDCIQKTMDILNCNITTLPYTATGMPRRDVQRIGRKNKAKQKYNNRKQTFEEYIFSEKVYHGGYSHGNRHYIDYVVNKPVECYDFSSSYPSVLIYEKYPAEGWTHTDDYTADDIIAEMDDYAFMFNLHLFNVNLKPGIVMPALQFSKADKVINAVNDNGRLLACDYIQIPITEQDLYIIMQQYDYDKITVSNVHFAEKDYLPRWLTDYIYSLYKDKCELKGGDPVLYDIQKSKLNSVYGLHVMKCVKFDNVEDYDTGEYYVNDNPIEDGYIEPEELYKKYTNKWGTILPYQWGVWCTAYAFKNLFMLGDCIGDGGQWLYSDTDSCYGYGWDSDKIDAYNNNIRAKLKARGYDPIVINGKEYIPGIAELDGEYTQFKCVGAKRYVCRNLDGSLKVTVAGVPKKTPDGKNAGDLCLENNIDNFTPGFIFSGEVTGKLQHTYIFNENIYINDYGDEVGDSIDLSSCDYELDKAYIDNFDDLFTEELEGIAYYG